MAAIIKRWVGDARHSLAGCAGTLAALAGRRILDRQGSLDWLRAHGLASEPGVVGEMRDSRGSDILRLGVVRAADGRCLDLDYGARAALSGWSGPVVDCDHAAALWSHPWMGYYHWILDVAPKIVLMQEKYGLALGPLKLCYPRTDASFESETLELLGVPASAVLDTRPVRRVHTQKLDYVLLPGWYQVQAAAALLRSRLLDKAAPGQGKRLYLARAGRRKCLDEQKVFSALRQRGFLFVEDKPRSLPEQIGLFRNAEAIVTPHGAALTNLLWCEPGTLVVELFGPNYQPPYYENLSQFRGLDYRPLRAAATGPAHWSAMDEDIPVDIGGLMNLLDAAGIPSIA